MSPPWVAVAAFAVDLAIGDPRWMPHPVVIIGSAISRLEGLLNQPRWSPAVRKIAGAAVAALVVAGSYAATWFLLRAAWAVSPWAGTLLAVWVYSTTLATRGLASAGLEIAGLLSRGDLPEARRKVGWIVGRDTANMEEGDVCRAAVETVAENTSDGVVAPLLYGFIGGPALAMAYKAVNTLDSMVGYKNSRYLDFGWASAKLDDLANLVPARASGLLLCAASWILGSGWVRPWRAMGASAHLHPSPNSGYPESAVAGALRVELGGLNYYGGVPQERARMGKPELPLKVEGLVGAVRLMVLASTLALVLLETGSLLALRG